MRHYPPRQPGGTHTGWTKHRDRAAQQRFRNALMARAQGQCEHEGCTTRIDLQAHHIHPGYTPDCGLLLCRKHHKQADPQAR